jgi:hypothetical protein
MPKREKPFHLDIPFDEALRRYAQADPREVAEREKKAKKQRRQKRAASSAHPIPTRPGNS